MEPDPGGQRVLVAVSPPLLAEAILCMIRRPGLVCHVVSGPVRQHAEEGVYVLAITNGVTLMADVAELVITLPPPPDGMDVTPRPPSDQAMPPVVRVGTLAELAQVVELVTALSR